MPQLVFINSGKVAIVMVYQELQAMRISWGASRMSRSQNHSTGANQGALTDVFQHFNRKHAYVFLGFYLAFACLTFFVMSRQSASDWRENWNVAASVGCLSGPFTGAIARHFQSCCWQFSVSLLPYSAAFLLGGIAFQFVPLPGQVVQRSLRLVAWSVGLFGWFGGGVVSFGHALS
jgi:hypothetical protein